jgi:hypothetical protein
VVYIKAVDQEWLECLVICGVDHLDLIAHHLVASY